MTYRDFWKPLAAVYPEDEARWIGRFVFEVKYGLSHADLLMGRETSIGQDELLAVQQRLLTGEPVQYVLGVSPFGEHLFRVSPAVLIPRPETLWLCRAAAAALVNLPPGRAVLDVGTGSGCIAITIAKRLSTSDVVAAWDVSSEALAVARANAASLHASVTFEQRDILAPPDDAARWDVIVSNPPYICEREKATMERNVLDHEPHLALFVPDADPLLFYRAITKYAAKALRPGGTLLFEINPLYATPLCAMLSAQGFTDVRIRQDNDGKARYAVAVAPLSPL